MRYSRWKLYGADTLWNLNELKASRATSEIVDGLKLRTTSLSNIHVVDITYQHHTASSARALKLSLLHL